MKEKEAVDIMGAYRCVPRGRPNQMIIVGAVHQQLQGVPLANCSDAQIYTAARRLFNEAREYFKRQDPTFFDEPYDFQSAYELLSVRRDHTQRMRETFNEPDGDPEELEARLLD